MASSEPKTALARKFRKAMTDPERLLWYRLKDRDSGIVFKRQKPFGPYILDFYCFSAQLVVEIDGITHRGDEATARDAARDAYLISHGLRVYRVNAVDIYRNVNEVAARIRFLAEERIDGGK